MPRWHLEVLCVGVDAVDKEQGRARKNACTIGQLRGLVFAKMEFSKAFREKRVAVCREMSEIVGTLPGAKLRDGRAEPGSMMSTLTMRILTAVLFVTTAIVSSSAAPTKRPLTREELKMARECQKGKPCSLTCNRAHDAGRDDLIRKGACAE